MTVATHLLDRSAVEDVAASRERHLELLGRDAATAVRVYRHEELSCARVCDDAVRKRVARRRTIRTGSTVRRVAGRGSPVAAAVAAVSHVMKEGKEGPAKGRKRKQQVRQDRLHLASHCAPGFRYTLASSPICSFGQLTLGWLALAVSFAWAGATPRRFPAHEEARHCRTSSPAVWVDTLVG